MEHTAWRPEGRRRRRGSGGARSEALLGAHSRPWGWSQGCGPALRPVQGAAKRAGGWGREARRSQGLGLVLVGRERRLLPARHAGRRVGARDIGPGGAHCPYPPPQLLAPGAPFPWPPHSGFLRELSGRPRVAGALSHPHPELKSRGEALWGVGPRQDATSLWGRGVLQAAWVPNF